MPTIFRDPEPELTELVRLVIRDYHPKLAEADVRVGVLLAYNAEGEAIKVGGYAALATMKPESAKERAKWGRDALLTIDEKEWADLTDEQRVALLDHELSHITTVPLKGAELRHAVADGGPRYKTDDRGRPKLKSVPGNWNAGDGFNEVIARHGVHAIEFRNIDHAKRSADRARRQGELDREAEARENAGEDAA